MGELSSEERISEAAVKAAQKAAKRFGLEEGGRVVHPSSDFVWRLVAETDNTLLVERPSPDGGVIQGTLPKEDAFNLEDAEYTAAFGSSEVKKRRRKRS